jgi:hypothetical protein
MVLNFLLKKPILIIGIVMFSLFAYQVAKKEGWIDSSDKFASTSCKGVVVGLQKRIPDNWKVFCEGNNLAVDIKEVAVPEKAANFRELMYRQLANHMTHVARISTPDILQKVMFVRFHIVHPKMTLDAVTEGQYIVKLATLENAEHIMSHLKATVQVKETLK